MGAKLAMAITICSSFYQNLAKHRKTSMLSIVFLDSCYVGFVADISSYGLVVFLLYHNSCSISIVIVGSPM